MTDSKGRRIVQLMARHTGKMAYLEVIVPIGISIPYGVELQLAETIKLTPRLADCEPSGCRAVAPLDEKTLANIRAAKGLTVVFQKLEVRQGAEGQRLDQRLPRWCRKGFGGELSGSLFERASDRKTGPQLSGSTLTLPLLPVRFELL